MPDKGRWPGDLHVAGNLSADSMSPPDGSVGDSAIEAGANVSALKLEQQYMPTVRTAGAVANKTEVLHVANAPGTLFEISAGTITLCTGTASITIDVLKNGVSVLSADLVLDSGNTARVLELASLDPAAVDYDAGDWFEVTITIATPTGAVGSGLVVRGLFREEAA